MVKTGPFSDRLSVRLEIEPPLATGSGANLQACASILPDSINHFWKENG